MSVKINYSAHHRHTSLGNNILQYLMGQYCAIKFNLLFDCEININKNYFNVNKYSGNNNYNNLIEINDNNCLNIFNKNYEINNCGISIKGYFQKKELFENKNYWDLCKNFIVPKINASMDVDLFVHVRLNDVADANMNLPFEYYDDQIQKINCNNIIISTDSPSHLIIKKLLTKYPNSVLLEAEDASHAIYSGINCKNLIIGPGSFGFCMALFSKENTNIYCINHERIRSHFNVTVWDDTMVEGLKNRPNTYFY